jgi:hypothetical protein
MEVKVCLSGNLHRNGFGSLKLRRESPRLHGLHRARDSDVVCRAIRANNKAQCDCPFVTCFPFLVSIFGLGRVRRMRRVMQVGKSVWSPATNRNLAPAEGGRSAEGIAIAMRETQQSVSYLLSKLKSALYECKRCDE